MTRLLVIAIAFIVYGSLYPWEFRPAPPGQSALDVLLHSWPAQLTNSDIGDIVVNLIVYVPVGMFGFLALDRTRRERLRWVTPVLLAFALSASMELLQVYDRTRVASLLDLLTNTLGALAGTFLGFLFRRTMYQGMFLVLYWLAFQIVAACAELIGKRAKPAFGLLDTASYAAAWAVAIYMAAKPAAAFVRAKRELALAILFFAVITVRGLAPFHLQRYPTPFIWIPMHTLLSTEWIIGLPTFFEKSFYYGAAIWLYRSAGLTLTAATALVAIPLAMIEIIQRYLPGRTPETTDPFLAVMLGCMLWLIEQDYARIKQSDLRKLTT